jgi:hypothetical protein
MEKLKWYSNRLRQMSFMEVSYRSLTMALNWAQGHGVFTAAEVPQPHLVESSATSANWLNVPPSVDIQRYVDAADRILAGRMRIFALADVPLGQRPNWNRDPRTGIATPLRFGKSLDYRDKSLVGDIKYLWELNRHLQFVTLAQAYLLTAHKRYLLGLKNQLNSWFDQCPYLLGPNWVSSLELAIRLINWSLVWRLIGGTNSHLFNDVDGQAFRDRWLQSVYQHCHFISGHLSRYSSANNHLIGEAAGLFVAGTTWPFWSRMRVWRDTGQKMLIEQALLQNGTDGVNREQAISYQQFILDFLIISALAGRTSELEFPVAYWERIEAMLVYLASVIDVGGNVPMIGDADDGYVVRLSQEKDFCPYRSLLATGAVLFKRPELKFKAGKLDDKSRWLLGQEAVQDFDTISTNDAVQLPIQRVFPEGGYFILGDNFETEKEIRLIVDAGTLGYLSIAAHGHADALSVILSVGGREFLIDPGTYTYQAQQQWRNYFRGTSAHNTVRVDGIDQSASGGSFMWLRHANARCESLSLGEYVDHFVGSHDGYSGLSDPVIHRREIHLFKSDKKISVIDSIECRGEHLVERFWHFSEQCRIFLDEAAVIAENDGIRICITPLETAVETFTAYGNEVIPLGWVSRSFDHKEPTNTVTWKSNIKRYTKLETEIKILS